MSESQERASKKQQELLSFVDGFIKGNGFGPSYREIMRALGYRSVSTVAIHIDGLITKGYLARRDKSARSLEVVTTRQDTVIAQATQVVDSDKTVEFELIGRIKTVELTTEQRASAADIFKLLGFKSVAAMLKKENNETAP